MKKILIVDDEIQILKSLKRIFFDTEYSIITAESGYEALEVLKKEKVDLIITDMRMPSMDGYELLCRVKRLYPKVIRVIISGYADEKIVIKALQNNIAKLYIFKPWDNNVFIRKIAHILDTEELLSSQKLLSLFNNIEELPTIKSSYQRIVELMERDEDISKISKEIEKDQAISIKLLHIANSAYYGAQTGSVQKAVMYLGLQNIRNLIISTSIIDSMSVKGLGLEHIEKLWRHSFLTNKILNFIYSKFFNKKLPEVASSAGILHNIGILFLLKYFPEQYSQLYKMAKEGLAGDEIEEFRDWHQHVGAYLLRWWELPFPIIESALYHHNPFDSRIINTQLVISVHIAQKYAWEILKSPSFFTFYDEGFNKIEVDQKNFEETLYRSEIIEDTTL